MRRVYSKDIHSGGTGIFSDMKDELWKFLEHTEKIISYDDLLLDGRKLNEAFNQCLKKWRDFPRHRYVINYLCEYFKCFFSSKDKELLFCELEKEERTFSRTSEQILFSLAQEILNIAREEAGKEYPEVILDEIYIRNNLIHFNDRFLIRFLAPVLNMDLDSLNIFLTRVLGRDGLDYYDYEEFLLYMALNHVYLKNDKERKVQMTTMDAYMELCRIYENLHPSDKEEKNTMQTLYIKDTADQLLDGNKSMYLMPEMSGELADILQWHRDLYVPEERTADREFHSLFSNVRKLYDQEIQDFYKLQEKGNYSKEDRRKSIIADLTIEYRPGEAVVMDKDTVFISGRQNRYTLLQDQLSSDGRLVLPQREYISDCMIHVRAKEDNPKIKGKKFIPENAELTMSDRELQEAYHVHNIHAYVNNTHETGKTRPVFCRADDKNKGFLQMDCDLGAVIPAGTEFCFEFNGVEYRFESVEEYCVPDYLTYKVQVMILADSVVNVFKKANKKQDYDVVEGTTDFNNPNTFWTVRPIQDGIHRIYNEKRVTYSRKGVKEEGHELKIYYDPKERIRLQKNSVFYTEHKKGNEFVLLHDETLEVKKYTEMEVKVQSLKNLPPEQKNKRMRPDMVLVPEKDMQDIIYSVRTGRKELPLLYASEKNGILKIQCPFGITIPKGTHFVFKKNEETYTFETIEDYKAPVWAKAAIRVWCKSETPHILAKPSNGDLIAATKSVQYMKDKPKGIYKIENEKPFIIPKDEVKKELSSGEEFIEYMYSDVDFNYLMRELAYLNSRLKIDVENLDIEWFRDTFIDLDVIEHFSTLSISKKRNVLIMLKFLEFVKEAENLRETDDDPEDKAELLISFEKQMDELMGKCRLAEYYIGKPADSFFTYLLLVGGDEYEILRTIYKLYKKPRSDAEEELWED